MLLDAAMADDDNDDDGDSDDDDYDDDDDDDNDDDDTCNLSESGNIFFPAHSLYHSQKVSRVHPIMKLLTDGNFNSMIVLTFCL